MLPERPRVLVAGAGGLGSVFGGLLARSGVDVELLASERHVRSIHERGELVVEAFGETLRARVRAEWRAERVSPADVLIVASKAPDTERLLDSIADVAGRVAVAFSVQNGVEKDALLSDWCAPGAVIGATTMAGGELIEPGVVRHTLRGLTLLGELAGGSSARVGAVAAMLTAAGLEALAVDDIRSAEWSKLTMAAPVQAVAALTRSRFHETLATPELARVVARLTRECTDVAQAAGIELRDWPSLSPVATLAALSFDDLVAALETQGRDLSERGLTDIRPSMLQSVERGRGLEVEALQGFVAREARRHGVAVPATDVCRELLAGMNRRLTTHAPEEVAGAR